MDPQTLFTQFAPNIFFDEPKRSNDLPVGENNQQEVWYTVAEQSVPTTIHPFWKTIVS